MRSGRPFPRVGDHQQARQGVDAIVMRTTPGRFQSAAQVQRIVGFGKFVAMRDAMVYPGASGDR